MNWQRGDLFYVFLDIPLRELAPVFHVGIYVNDLFVFEFGTRSWIDESNWVELLVDPGTIPEKSWEPLVGVFTLKEYLSKRKLAYCRRFPKEKLRSETEMTRFCQKILDEKIPYQLFTFNCEIAALNVVLQVPLEYINKTQADLGRQLYQRFWDETFTDSDIIDKYLSYMSLLLQRLKFKFTRCYLFSNDLRECVVKGVTNHHFYPELLEISRECREFIITSLISDEELYQVSYRK
jgi:hypothetical protein